MFALNETFIQNQRNKLSEVCGKQLTGEDLYLAPNSTKRNRNSELSSNNKIKLCNKLSC